MNILRKLLVPAAALIAPFTLTSCVTYLDDGCYNTGYYGGGYNRVATYCPPPVYVAPRPYCPPGYSSSCYRPVYRSYGYSYTGGHGGGHYSGPRGGYSGHGGGYGGGYHGGGYSSHGGGRRHCR